jgi:hypothetical protein
VVFMFESCDLSSGAAYHHVEISPWAGEWMYHTSLY